MLINGDCTTELKKNKSESFNLIYSDPPYEMKYISNIPGSKHWNKKQITNSKFKSHLKGDDGGIDWQLIWKEFYRVLKNNSFLFLHLNFNFLMNYGKDIENTGFKMKGVIAWSKKFAIGGDLKSSMKRDWEPIVYFVKGKPSFYPVEVLRKGNIEKRNRISEIGDWEFMLKAKEKCGHPTQKPVKLAKQIISLTTKEGEMILDPFAGSGTAGLAARELKRNYLLIEDDKKIYNIMTKRLKI